MRAGRPGGSPDAGSGRPTWLGCRSSTPTASYRVADPALSRDAGDIRALRSIAGQIHQLLACRQSFVSETVGANAAYRRYVQGAKAAGSRCWT